MLDKKSLKYELISRTIDQFMTMDLTGVGLIKGLYESTIKHQDGYMCMTAAEMIVDTCQKDRGPALIATGFPEGGGVPETDGLVGAAMLARALFLSLGIETLIVTDADWEPAVKAACLGAGLAPMSLPESGIIETIDFIRPVYIKTVPKQWDSCHQISDELLEVTKPRILFAIERPGMNKKGIYYGLGGRVLDDLVGDLDYLFRKGKEKGIPFIAFGDGGNELGMGVIKDELPRFSPKAADCGCPCHGGIGSETAADILIAANVSNWGVTGVVAALAALLENPTILHEPELEIRSIDQCTTAGAVDGMTMGTEAAVDGISALEWGGLIRALRGTVLRTLGFTVDWRGHSGDWRQLK